MVTYLKFLEKCSEEKKNKIVIVKKNNYVSYVSSILFVKHIINQSN